MAREQPVLQPVHKPSVGRFAAGRRPGPGWMLSASGRVTSSHDSIVLRRPIAASLV
jgi:hypothetical protein